MNGSRSSSRPEHFADPIHGRIYQAIARRVEAGQLADAVTLKAEFEHSGVLEEVGGTAYLAQLLTAMVGIINAGEYGRAIHDAWLRRQLIDIGETVVNNAFGADAELAGSQQIEAAEQSLFDLATRGSTGGGFVTFEKALIEAIQGAERAFHRSGHVAGPHHRAARPGRQDRRDASVRPDDPGRPAGHGQDGARHQDRVRRGQVAAGGGARQGRQRRAARLRGDLLAGNEFGTVGHPPAVGRSAGVQRQDPQGRDPPAGFRPVRAGQPRAGTACRSRSTTRRR